MKFISLFLALAVVALAKNTASFAEQKPENYNLVEVPSRHDFVSSQSFPANALVEARSQEKNEGHGSDRIQRTALSEKEEARALALIEKSPLLWAICECESRLRHYTQNGEVLRGEINPKDIGLCQINERWHGKEAERLGLDIYHPVDNVIYAWTLLEKQGPTPWVCWKNQPTKIQERAAALLSRKG